jgi:carboxyl-terminal processing protease
MINPTRRMRVTAVAGLFLLSMLSGAWLLDRGARTGTFTAYEAAHLYDDVYRHVSNDFVDTVSDSALYRKSVDGMLFELHDPYSVFLSPDRFTRLGEMVSGDYAGLGIEVDIRGGTIVIVAPLPGSPAERAGVQSGDRIIKIDGKSTEGWTNEEATKALRGKPGTTVNLEIERAGSSAPVRLTVTRQAIHQSAVRRTAMLSNDVGYLDLKAFSDSTASEVSHAVETLLGRGMKSLIIDLRTNPGGLLSEGVRVSDLFLDPGQRIVSLRGRVQSGDRSYADSSKQRWPTLPIAIVVDGRSASAAEIVAGALQDHDRAVIVGLPTYGKGSAQTVFPFGAAGGLKLTTAKWYTPSGRSINKLIIDPDDPDADQTAVLQRKRFHTDAGRVVYGAGGITPDVYAGDTALTPVESALITALGTKAGIFRDEVTALALDVKGKHSVASPNFEVTPVLLDDLYRRLVARGVKIDRATYDDAKAVVSRVLGVEIERYVFGFDAELRRRASTDAALAKALQLTEGVKTEPDLLRRAALDKSSADSLAK